MALTENDIPAAPPLEGGENAPLAGAPGAAPPAAAPDRATPPVDPRAGEGQDGDAQERATTDGRDAALRAVQVALIKEIDASISKLERARIGESTREHLEILRSLLKAQVTAYLEHFVARRATLF
jgi:hypothetical protein